MTPYDKFKQWYKVKTGHFPEPENDTDRSVIFAMYNAWLEAFHQGKLEGLKEAGEIAKRINTKEYDNEET